MAAETRRSRVDRPDRRSHQQVRPDAALEQRLEHSRLTGAETGSTGETNAVGTEVRMVIPVEYQGASVPRR